MDPINEHILRRFEYLGMKPFFATLPRNLLACFKGKMMVCHGIAILLTLIAVESGSDWWYFVHTRGPILWALAIPSAAIGFFVPVIVPLALISAGFILQNVKISSIGWAIGQAAVLGSLISSAYKTVTGRQHPDRTMGLDISAGFRFGWLRGGAFWGWPSSHTTIAFAMAVTALTLFPQKRLLCAAALVYAIYIGIGVSMTIHWFSDFAAGAIIGSVIGRVVGTTFFSSTGETATVDKAV